MEGTIAEVRLSLCAINLSDLQRAWNSRVSSAKLGHLLLDERIILGAACTAVVANFAGLARLIASWKVQHDISANEPHVFAISIFWGHLQQFIARSCQE